MDQQQLPENFNRAVQLMNNNEHVSALAIFNELIKQNIVAENLHLFRGWCMAHIGTLSDARAAIIEELQRFPQNFAAQDLLKQIEQKILLTIPEKYYRRPIHIKVELTNVCNARCNFCAYKNVKAPPRTMDEGLFDKIIADFLAIGGGPVSISPVVGETLLNKDIVKHAQKLKNLPSITGVGFHTNLLALTNYTDDEIEIMLNSIDWLGVSLGANKDDYRGAFGVDGFEKVLASVECLLRYKKRGNLLPQISFNGRALKKNPIVDQRLLAMANELGIPAISWIGAYADWGGETQDFSQEHQIIKTNRSGVITPTCKHMIMYGTIFANGEVTACPCADAYGKMKIGSVKEMSLSEILANPARRELIMNFHEGKPHPYCAKCTFYEPFNPVEAANWHDWVSPYHMGSIFKVINGALTRVVQR